MAVNLRPPRAEELFPVAGLRLGIAQAGIRRVGRKDLLLMELAEGSRTAAIFTRNRFCAAPVIVAKNHLAQSSTRAVLVNTGCANAGTGAEGVARAGQTCEAVARLLGCRTMQVLPFSTGVIMEPLPVEKIVQALPRCVENLREDNWIDASEAIMTTDTVPKALSRRIRLGDSSVTVSGIAKGSGMIRPNLATMLSFMATDAPVAQPLLQSMAGYAAERSFNCVTVDGDTSTNDSFVMISTAKACIPEITNSESPEFRQLLAAVTGIATELAQALVRDGEGATKFITIVVEGGTSESECRRVGYAVAHSPLVKTAFFASDPNLGRILAAIGNAGIEDLNVDLVDLYLDDVLVAQHGGRASSYREEDGKRVMSQQEIRVRICLHRGGASGTVWTCDLSHEYVSINADYRS